MHFCVIICALCTVHSQFWCATMILPTISQSWWIVHFFLCPWAHIFVGEELDKEKEQEKGQSLIKFMWCPTPLGLGVFSTPNSYGYYVLSMSIFSKKSLVINSISAIYIFWIFLSSIDINIFENCFSKEISIFFKSVDI